MFSNQPDIILDKISSFLTVFEIQRLSWLSKGIHGKISDNWIWKNLLIRESLEYEAVSPTYAKRLLLSLHNVTLPINPHKVEFFFQLRNFGKVIASGGPGNVKDWTEPDVEVDIFGHSPVPFEQEVNVADDCDFWLTITARYEGMSAKICNTDLGNWDENLWWSEGAASAGEFAVDVKMFFNEDNCENEYCAREASYPWLVFPYCEEDEKLDFESYLEQLHWVQYKSGVHNKKRARSESNHN